jgi:aspartate aminotransferase
MKLSKRIRNITPSATMELTAKVADLRARGVEIISYNVGEPDFPTPKNIAEAAKAAIDANKTKYTVVPGILELRQAISKKLREENGLEYSPAEISVGVGAKQPLINAVLALCEEGDEVILPTPCWVSYEEMIKLAGGKPVLVPTREENGFALDLPAIEAAITPKTAAVLINTPNNPTGAVYSEESLRALASICVKHEIAIISDEVYEKLIYGNGKHFSIAASSPEAKHLTVTINGFSKAYAMTGWRVGYAAADAAIIKGMNALASHATSNICSIAQYAALEGLTGPQDSVEAMRQEFDRRRVFLTDRLNGMDGISCAPAEGAFYLMPNVSSFYGKKTPDGKVITDSFALADYLLEDAHIAVVPGAAFESPDNLRISYSNSLEALRQGMDQMEASLKKLV